MQSQRRKTEEAGGRHSLGGRGRGGDTCVGPVCGAPLRCSKIMAGRMQALRLLEFLSLLDGDS